jgi:asparagine synthase (glutamine-hydrolysing)
MQDRLPSPILRHSKIGFDIPAHEWLRGPLRELMQDTLAWGAAEHNDLFEPRQVQACVDAHLSRRANYGYHLWGLTILFLWLKRWRIQTIASAAVDLKLAAISS